MDQVQLACAEHLRETISILSEHINDLLRKLEDKLLNANEARELCLEVEMLDHQRKEAYEQLKEVTSV